MVRRTRKKSIQVRGQEVVADDVGAPLERQQRRQGVRPADEVGGAQEPATDESADDPPLQRRDGRGHPVALGVVAEAVVRGGEVVLGPLGGGAIEDLLATVVAAHRGVVDEPPDAEDEVVGAVHDAVEEVDLRVSGRRQRLAAECLGRAEMPVLQPDERPGGDEAERRSREDAEGAVGTVEHVEGERLALGGADEDLAGAGDDLVLETRVVEAAVAEGHRLDGAAGDGAAHGDALELGDDGG